MSSNRKSKSEKEREKMVQDRLQILLTRMLQDDDNKYCVDCDAKGPRWASWNLGLFMCIRCAGIHRNLGVHISKVKSVNLDSWTPHQVASMQITGNSRGRAIYEAQVSEDFRRPQTDSQLEVFIRAKYEKKKYIAREYIPTKAPEYPLGWNELIEAEKLKKDPRSVTLTSASPPLHKSIRPLATSTATDKPSSSTKAPVTSPKSKTDPTIQVSPGNLLSSDLLGLSITGISTTPEIVATKPQEVTKATNYSSDLLGLSGGVGTSSDFDFLGTCQNFNNNAQPHTSKSESNLFDLSSSGGVTNATDATKMSKDSIMALFNQPQAPPQQQLPVPNFMTDFGAAPKIQHPLSNFGVVPHQGMLVGAALPSSNNPFLSTTTTIGFNTSQSNPNIEQSSAFAGINSRHFFQ